MAFDSSILPKSAAVCGKLITSLFFSSGTSFAHLQLKKMLFKRKNRCFLHRL